MGSGENGMNMGAGAVCGSAEIEGSISSARELGLTITPNPVRAGDAFSIDGDIKTASLEIFGVDGRLVWTLNRPYNQWRWMVSTAPSWPKGVYFVRVRGVGGSEVAKVSIIH